VQIPRDDREREASDPSSDHDYKAGPVVLLLISTTSHPILFKPFGEQSNLVVRFRGSTRSPFSPRWSRDFDLFVGSHHKSIVQNQVFSLLPNQSSVSP
jgi:hypothetical protein